ncbi:MAG TPA: aminotransferase class I/II-fold pyridoxal phosphate-dependent enzyme [Candidatus Binatia bacterium]|nr:aminotransferase class I/II-fold pyridoxal phosphate-dependent enzyme [Candidatus Binatia bacterium]
MDLIASLEQAVDAVESWESRWSAFSTHPSVIADPERSAAVLEELGRRLRDNYPFFHPSYAGQMMKPPHPVAAAAYLMAMLINPNNHALDGGPATAAMEREVVAQIAAMLHLPADFLGHLTSSGTIANLEALFVARELHPEAAIAYSDEAHYTHGRMCHLLGVTGVRIPSDERGRMDLDALEGALRTGRIGTVVLTAGTTALGGVDPIHQALALRERYGVRIHVDAAYGGFYAILAWSGASGIPGEEFRAIARCDSAVVDPHKHGLQPYGCGCVLFPDPSVARFYRHDSPYTYFTSRDLHLGEISLECSRAGAAAAALWATLQLFPLTDSGLGPVLAACRRAALGFAESVRVSGCLRLHQEPELDIVTYFPWQAGMTGDEVDAASQRLFERAMTAGEPAYLSVARVDAAAFHRRHPDIPASDGPVRVLRSVLMKPEHEEHAAAIVERLCRMAS